MNRTILTKTVTILATILCACSSSESAGTSASVSSLIEQIPEDDPTRQEYMEQSSAAETGLSDADAEEPRQENGMDAGDSATTVLYEQFLDNEAEAIFHSDRAEYYDVYFDLDLTDGNEYTLSELAATLPENANRDDIAYAYLDCGHDGDEELVVRIGSGDYMWVYWVIKDVDGSLECIYSRVAWPRSTIKINQYGLIRGSGSSGAAHQTYDELFLDTTGSNRYIYTLDVIGFTATADGYGAIYEYDIMPPDGTGSADQRSFTLLQYDFDNTTDDYMNDAFTYGERVSTYSADDGSSDMGRIYNSLSQDESIYDDGFPLKTQLIDAGFQVYRFSEIDEMIDAQENYYGITQEILDAPEVEWTVLSTQ